MSDSKPKEQKINIELDEATAEGTYSNLAIINHSVSEFIVDFISIVVPKPDVLAHFRVEQSFAYFLIYQEYVILGDP